MSLPIPDPKPTLPLTDAQLAAWEASRDLEAELLESVQQYKRGEGRVVHSPEAVEPKRAGIAPP
jgi:putative transcriptional regulator